MGRYINTGTKITNTGAKKVFFNANASGTAQTWTVPDGITCATFEIWGGGGAGSPSCCCTCYGGEGGSGGAYSLKTIPVTPGSTYQVYVGQGGCGNQCWFNGNACGCYGCKSYVTGTGLSNFCADGGVGGGWCNAIGTASPPAAYGGDVNLSGLRPFKANTCNWSGCTGFSSGGPSPFGGGLNINPGGVGSASHLFNCGLTGAFPGGGSPGKTMFRDGWCDCCQGCTGGGADGLVIITI